MTDRRRRIVWALGDGIPGHLSHSRGLIGALERLAPLDVRWIEARLTWGGARALVGPVLNHWPGPLAGRIVQAVYRCDLPEDGPPDLILSSGGRTSFLNAALALNWGCPNLFAGTLRGLRETLFSAFVTPFPVTGATRNRVVPVPLTDLEVDTARAAGEALRQELGGGSQPLWTMLIGGAAPGYHFDAQDWDRLAEAMALLADRHGIRWLVATSRRSGVDAETRLKACLTKEVLAQATWYGEEPRPVVASYLGAAARVFCTEDSMSMLGEAAATARPVYGLAPAKARPEGRNALILERLSGDRRVFRLPIADLSRPEALVQPEAFDLLRRSPLDLLAEQLQHDLPGFCQ